MKKKGNKRNEENKTKTQLLISMHCTYIFISFRFSFARFAFSLNFQRAHSKRNGNGTTPCCMSERASGGCFTLSHARARSLALTHTHMHTNSHSHCAYWRSSSCGAELRFAVNVIACVCECEQEAEVQTGSPNSYVTLLSFLLFLLST